MLLFSKLNLLNADNKNYSELDEVIQALKILMEMLGNMVEKKVN